MEEEWQNSIIAVSYTHLDVYKRQICDKEGFAIGDDDYQKALQDMLTEYGCTEDELIQTYGQDNVEQSIMLNRVSNLILENANVTDCLLYTSRCV